MKKQQALDKLKDLESEISKLKDIINQPEDLFSKIKNYFDVCKELNEKEITSFDFGSNINKKDLNKLINAAKIKQIERLFNGDWIPKFDGKQYNYYPYFTGIGVGVVFYDSSYCYGSLGQVAYYKDKKTSDFVGKMFIDIYREI